MRIGEAGPEGRIELSCCTAGRGRVTAGSGRVTAGRHSGQEESGGEMAVGQGVNVMEGSAEGVLSWGDGVPGKKVLGGEKIKRRRNL